ncbi:MAG: hypothetical protein GY800_08115 [Planctomycetes bacterium]|nr:hypothetical protein [Planctomycetota bacterium]
MNLAITLSKEVKKIISTYADYYKLFNPGDFRHTRAAPHTGRITIAGNRNIGTSLNGPDAEEHNGAQNRQQYPVFI